MDYSSFFFKAHQLVKKERPALEWLRIYGEIFGGSYPSKDVPAVKNASVVQRGIWYCPHNDFYAFGMCSGVAVLEDD